MKKSYAVAMLAVLMLPASASAQLESFIVKVRTDTIAVETFTLTGSRLEGELTVRGAAAHIKYYGDIINGKVPILYTSLRRDPDTTTAQSAITRFQSDSAIVEMSANGVSTTQRLVAAHGALPLINLAFSFVEIAARELHGDTATVPFFLLNGGQTVMAVLKRVRPDSMVVGMSGVELVLNIDQEGRILRGSVPAQAVTIERIAGSTRLSQTRPDYSASAGAPFTAENVTIATSQGYTLAGTLTLPRQRSGRVPVVVTISGSGLQDRDEALPTVPSYKPFRQIAEALAVRGVGVLRYDDRGFGESHGDPAAATTADFANDTRAVLAYLRQRAEVDSTRLFLLGHSEGGVIAPMIARTDKRIRGLVLLAGTARTGRRVIEYQNRFAIEQRPGLSTTQRDSLFGVARASLDSVALRQPWLAYFLDYDPLVAAREVEQPVLILQGATDRQVTADQAEELAAAIRSGRNRDVTVHVLPDVNHLFLRDASGNPAGYAALPDKKIVQTALDLMVDWILQHAK